MTTIANIQQVIRSYKFDAWVLYDFRGSNSIAWQLLGLPPEAHCTRRWMVVIPAEGTPVKIMHAMEQHPLEHVDAELQLYSRKEEWEQITASALQGYTTIAMEYSPGGELPVVAKVDAGTIERLRALGLEIASSADLAQEFTAVWTEDQVAENMATADKLYSVMMYAFEFIRHNLQQERVFTEFDVITAIQNRFEELELVSSHTPNVSVNANAANPHYHATAEHNTPIGYGDLVLIDMWARTPNPHSTFADITWMGYAGEEVPERYSSVFSVIRDARDAVVSELRKRFENNEPVRGCDLDDIARTIIDKAGYGKEFFHRTGHSIAVEIHGPGTNLDNYETRDTRRILPLTSFSVEPGVYLPGEFGMRTEIDVVITKDKKVVVTGGTPQTAIIPLLAAEDPFTGLK